MGRDGQGYTILYCADVLKFGLLSSMVWRDRCGGIVCGGLSEILVQHAIVKYSWRLGGGGVMACICQALDRLSTRSIEGGWTGRGRGEGYVCREIARRPSASVTGVNCSVRY